MIPEMDRTSGERFHQRIIDRGNRSTIWPEPDLPPLETVLEGSGSSLLAGRRQRQPPRRAARRVHDARKVFQIFCQTLKGSRGKEKLVPARL